MAPITLADLITLGDFKDILDRYPALIETKAKPLKEGQTSLEDLDRFRYIDAPSRLSMKTGAKQIELPDIKKLVEWKIHHGKYRPFLPKLVASNAEENAQEVTKKAFASYAAKSDVKVAVTIISEMKGIGPATASLILAVHDPENIMFFSDEAYHWLCAPDSEVPPDLKYNAKEYEELCAKAKLLMARLKVSPIDIEKVAYVLKRENEPGPTAKKSAGRPRSRPSLSEETQKSGNSTGRPRGRPKAEPKSTVPLEEPKKLSTPIGRPRGRPKSAPKPEIITAKGNPPVASNSTTRKSKRKADEDTLGVDKSAAKRGRPKAKTG